MDFSEAALRLPARFHHRDVYVQSAAPGRMTAGPSSESGARGEPPEPGEHSIALTKILSERIRAAGPISFAEFMRECLYHPAHGYYSRANPARFGDYYTSVDVHSISAASSPGNLRKCGNC